MIVQVDGVVYRSLVELLPQLLAGLDQAPANKLNLYVQNIMPIKNLGAGYDPFPLFVLLSRKINVCCLIVYTRLLTA